MPETPCRYSDDSQKLATQPGFVEESAPLTVTSQSLSESKALPLGFLLRGVNPRSLVDRVVWRLIQQEAQERKAGRVHFAEDKREAQIALLLWQRKAFPTLAECFTAASYGMFGCHPDHVFPKIVARRQAQLGAEYSKWYDERGNLRPDLFVVHSFPAPKKSARSERPLSPGGDVREG